MTAAARHLALPRPEALARAGDRPQKAAPLAAAKRHRKKERLEMTADNSPSRSLAIADVNPLRHGGGSRDRQIVDWLYHQAPNIGVLMLSNRS
jgi:hypothetical protein